MAFIISILVLEYDCLIGKTLRRLFTLEIIRNMCET